MVEGLPKKFSALYHSRTLIFGSLSADKFLLSKILFFKFSNKNIAPAYFLPKNSTPGAKNNLTQAILHLFLEKGLSSPENHKKVYPCSPKNEEWLELDYFWHRESNFWAKNRREEFFHWKI